MVQLVLEGDTLGKRHQHYNKALKETLAEQSTQLEKINIVDNDVNNLFKIDLANSRKNVEYILEVLKSEDMLYVFHAIKRCTWLITDPQYAHIVNPHYLHTQLFPHMTTKATNKLMLHIRLNLKDETRVEDFYNHFKTKDKKHALKWLPNCSIAFIEHEIENHEGRMEDFFLKRLCERSISFLEIHIRKNEHFNRSLLKATMFLIHTYPEKYFDIIDSVVHYNIPRFGPKFTSLIMKKCPERILNNFAKYCERIELHSFAKHLNKVDIKAFLLKHAVDESMQSWFQYDNLKHFARYLPKEGRFDFLKNVFIEKSQNVDSVTCYSNEMFTKSSTNSCAMSSCSISSPNVYRWYRYAQFHVAFSDLKKMLRTESSPAERTAMLGVLISCAGRNLQNINTLLQYYHDKHINEPFKFKIQFVNNVLSQIDTHVFDVKTWSILNNIFCSMEVYTESENNVQTCIQSILVYKVLHDEKVPEIIEKKFTFDTLQSLQIKLNKEEKNKVFTYLYNILVTKIQIINISNEAAFTDVLHLLEEVLKLLVDWKKELKDYPLVIHEIRKLIEIKAYNSWTVDISTLFNERKSWRKHLFEDSLALSPNEEACINALKHDPKLLERHRREVEALCCNDRVSLDRLLSKLRMYWPESMAIEWTNWYLGRLGSPSGHKALVRGLCALLPQMQLVDIVKRYAPTETKITWSEDDDILLNLRKQFAKNLYLARPPLSPETVLLYARGDYLQFALPSINALLHNLSPAHSRQHIARFLDAPVSLQKHGIRLAFTKLESKELKQTFSDVWKSTKNSSIRAILFKQTYALLCREKNSLMIEEIWELLDVFIDNLSSNEDKTIFDILGKVNKVPLIVRAKFCMKSYKYLKSLPAKANCESVIESIVYELVDIMEFLDSDFVAEILLETLDKKFTTQSYNYTNIVTSYLLCSKDKVSQTLKYEKILAPLLERSIDQWKQKIDGSFVARNNIMHILKMLCNDFEFYVMDKKMVVPVKMFEDIQTKLEGGLTLEENYKLLRNWKLTVTYVKLLEGQEAKILSLAGERKSYQSGGCFNREIYTTWHEVYQAVTPQFAELCIKYLREDVELYFPTIYLLYTKALKDMLSNMEIAQIVYLEILKCMLECKDLKECYLVVLEILPDIFINGDKESDKIFEIQEIIKSHSSPEIKMYYFEKYRS